MTSKTFWDPLILVPYGKYLCPSYLLERLATKPLTGGSGTPLLQGCIDIQIVLVKHSASDQTIRPGHHPIPSEMFLFINDDFLNRNYRANKFPVSFNSMVQWFHHDPVSLESLSSILDGLVGPTNILQRFSCYLPDRAAFVDPNCASLISEVETISFYNIQIRQPEQS